MTTAIRQPQQDRSRATRTRLLAAAIDSLAERGFAASTVAAVAERAGVSRGAAQHHFPTREALLLAAMEYVAAARGDQLRGELGRAPGATRPDTRAVVDAIFGLYDGPLFRAAIALWGAAATYPPLRAQLAPLEATLGGNAQRTVVAILNVDESVPGAREIIQETLDLARGLGLAGLLSDDSRRRARIAAHWSGLLDAALAGERRGPR